jgi:hypothetical protein
MQFGPGNDNIHPFGIGVRGGGVVGTDSDESEGGSGSDDYGESDEDGNVLPKKGRNPSRVPPQNARGEYWDLPMGNNVEKPGHPSQV